MRMITYLVSPNLACGEFLNMRIRKFAILCSLLESYSLHLKLRVVLWLLHLLRKELIQLDQCRRIEPTCCGGIWSVNYVLKRKVGLLFWDRGVLNRCQSTIYCFASNAVGLNGTNFCCHMIHILMIAFQPTKRICDFYIKI